MRELSANGRNDRRAAIGIQSRNFANQLKNVYTIDPLSDDRWVDLVNRHPRASVFHQRGWLQALAGTYGYKPFVLTSSPENQPLSDGMVLCCVSSWLTGSRLVSLPFSDHCEPLLSNDGDSSAFVNWLHQECDRRHCNYVELRPLPGDDRRGLGFEPSDSFWLHELDMTPGLEQIFQGLHKNSFQRKIRKAENEPLSYETGHSQQLIDGFYRLLLATRRRHELLPQPRKWFQNLVDCMGDKLQIRVAKKDDVPIAAILTLRHRSCTVYKYGCSDERFHNIGGMPLLFWKLIEESKSSGMEKIDFGRSDLDHVGLITFKDRLGTRRQLLNYYRYRNGKERKPWIRWGRERLRGLFSLLPDAVLSTAGGVLYRHTG